METHKITADQLRTGATEYVGADGVRIRIADLKPKFSYWDEHSVWTLGISPEGVEGRQVAQGPLVSERFGWLNQNATVIALHPLPEAPILEVRMGDVIEVEGHGRWLVAMTGGWDSRPTIQPVD